MTSGGDHIHDHLPSDGTDLNLDVDDTKRLGANVDLDEARVYGLVKLSESRNKANGSLKQR